MRRQLLVLCPRIGYYRPAAHCKHCKYCKFIDTKYMEVECTWK